MVNNRTEEWREMDVLFPVPDNPTNGDEVVEVVLPEWLIEMIDRQRGPLGLTRSQYVYDLIMEGFEG